MTMKDRLERGDPIHKAMYERLDALIKGHNALVKIVLQGKNPHEVNDTTNLITAGKAYDLDGVIDLAQDLITEYEAHLADSTSHVGADSTNVVTETGVPIEIYTLLNELKVDYTAHIALKSSDEHAGADSTNVITAANATTKALAILLANDLQTQMIANFANVTAHHGVPVDLYTLANELKVDYTAHIALTAGSVHAGADSTNVLTAADATDYATLITLVNDLQVQFIANFANVTTHHGAADTTNPPVLSSLVVDASWDLIQAATDELRASYEAHRVLLTDSVHGGADSTNTVTATAVGALSIVGDTTNPPVLAALTSDATWTLIQLVADELRASYVAHIAVDDTLLIHGAADSTNTVTATAIGTILTAAIAGPNEMKDDFNAHILEVGSYHVHSDISMLIDEADGSTLATVIILVNAMKEKYTDHISYAEENTAGPIVDTLDVE